MFISEKEARERLSSNDNLLRRLNIPTSEPHSDDASRQFDEPKRTEPTDASRGDDDRLAVLADRRATKSSPERGGRYPEQQNIPPIFRSLIGSAARLGSVKATAQTFGVSQLTTHEYKHGRVSGEVDTSLLSKIEQDTLAIRNQVLGVLAFTVAGITPESIENKDPKELSIIARNLSSIMTSTRPTESVEKNTNAQVIVFSPEQKEQDYDTVEIG